MSEERARLSSLLTWSYKLLASAVWDCTWSTVQERLEAVLYVLVPRTDRKSECRIIMSILRYRAIYYFLYYELPHEDKMRRFCCSRQMVLIAKTTPTRKASRTHTHTNETIKTWLMWEKSITTIANQCLLLDDFLHRSPPNIKSCATERSAFLYHTQLWAQTAE